jgi:hypothetical protein
MKTRWAILACVLATSCRRPILVDTSSSALIPRDLAIERLKETLATAEAAECTQPRNGLRQEEIKEWAVDDQGLEARAPGRASVGFAYKDVTATRLDKVNLFYQVRVFTPKQPHPKKDYVHFNFQDEAAARRALELLDALRNKTE